jgi:hypothetical protein
MASFLYSQILLWVSNPTYKFSFISKIKKLCTNNFVVYLGVRDRETDATVVNLNIYLYNANTVYEVVDASDALLGSAF